MLLFFLTAKDSISVDTTSLGYRIGFTFASLLPFIIIAFIFILLIRKRYKFPNK